MLARLALESDEDALVKLARQQTAETLPHLYSRFNEERARATFKRYLDGGNPVFWVAEKNREVVGFLMAMYYDYGMIDGQFTGQEVVYVRPDHRGSRASARLFDLYDAWTDRLKAPEAFTGVANGRKIEKYAKMMSRRGYDLVGMTFRKITGH